MLPPDLSYRPIEMISRRVGKLIEQPDAKSDLRHLKREDLKLVEPLRGWVRLVPIKNEHAADELAAQLHADMPWMAPATEEVWLALRRSAALGFRGAGFPPLVLNGPPGIGKSTWARRLGDLIGVPTGIVEPTSEAAGFAIAGVQKGWSSAAPGKPLELIIRKLIGNPVIVVDEVENAGAVRGSSGIAHGLADALLPMLEPANSRSWPCPYLQVPFDMSWISWVMTANDAACLNAPLLSRCQVISLPPICQSDLVSFLQREGGHRGLSDLSVDVAIEVLNESCANSEPASLRTALRLLARADALERRPRLH